MDAHLTSRFLSPELARLAEDQGRVLSLAQLTAAGIGREHRRAQVGAERWRDLPGHGVVVDLGPTETGISLWWRVLTILGPSARLGGVSALQADGLAFEELGPAPTHVWVPKSSYKGGRPAVDGVRLHESRRWLLSQDCAAVGVPRSRPAVATVQAALWAPTPRAAQLRLVVPIQQRLVTVHGVMEVLDRVRRHRFRSMLRATLVDIAGGSQSLGELDFARLCRAHAVPEPSRQVLRTGRRGRIYLDVYWEEYRVALEIDGAGHDRVDQRAQDEIRSLDLQASGSAAVQVSVLTLRSQPEPFFAALADLLVTRGWRRPRPPAGSRGPQPLRPPFRG